MHRRIAVSSWSFHTFFEPDRNDPDKVLWDGSVAHAKLREGQDFAGCMAIANEAGFTGIFSIEAGGRTDPYVEVQAIVDALVQHV